MKNLLSPKWLIIVNTIPLVILFFILAGDFRVIRTLLDEENIRLWWIFGGILGGLAILNLGYAAFLVVKKKQVPAWYSAFSLLVYIAYIYAYLYHVNDILPFRIPDWMMSGNLVIYACTFLMPTLVYSLFSLVVHLTAHPKRHKAWINFLIMVLVPVFVYLFFFFVLPLWDSGYQYIGDHFYIVSFIVFTLIFLFFLMRSFYIIAFKKYRAWNGFGLIWKIPFTIIFPLVGLLLNNGILEDNFFLGENVFGNLSNIWFYILALVNGILLCLPNLNRLNYRVILFIGRCITLSYSFYFFLVFLPYLPLSILAILAIGVGFLMLTPLVLFVIHTSVIYQDIHFLQKHFSKSKINWTIAVCFMVIPLSMSTVFFRDKIILNKALDYVYSTNYDKENIRINTKSLASTLHTIKMQKNSHSDILFYNYTPYISSYYNWLVLDNLTLSDEKISRLEQIFLYYPGYDDYRYEDEDFQSFASDTGYTDLEEEQPEEFIPLTGTVITDTAIESRYDEIRGSWVSWVHLEITNYVRAWGGAEYKTDILLPDGCWISDYYLYIEDKKEPGILSEKKSALWVYSQIRDENKDPGILHYISGNKIQFRVFPFSENEVRKTGIEFIHKEPVEINIDNRILQLGKPESGYPSVIHEPKENEYIEYVSVYKKQELKEVTRNSYFHFLVNVSGKAEEHREYFTSQIEKLLRENPTLAKDAKISLVDTYVQTIAANEDWKNIISKHKSTNGFFLDRGIKSALFQGYNLNSYPVIVVLTDTEKLITHDTDYGDFKFIFPESDKFYVISRREERGIKEHSLLQNPQKAIAGSKTDIFTPRFVLQYPHNDGTYSYVSKDKSPSIVFRKELYDIPTGEIKERNFDTALLLHANWISQNLYPEKSDKEWVKLAKYSFNSGIMTPVTSYIVVENESQREALKRKQKQVLASNKNYDTLDSNSSRMSEPDLLIPLFLLVGFIIYKRRRKIRYSG